MSGPTINELADKLGSLDAAVQPHWNPVEARLILVLADLWDHGDREVEWVCVHDLLKVECDNATVLSRARELIVEYEFLRETGESHKVANRPWFEIGGKVVEEADRIRKLVNSARVQLADAKPPNEPDADPDAVPVGACPPVSVTARSETPNEPSAEVATEVGKEQGQSDDSKPPHEPDAAAISGAGDDTDAVPVGAGEGLSEPASVKNRVLSDVQRRIMDALDGRAMTADELVAHLEIGRQTVFGRKKNEAGHNVGGITELMSEGGVENSRSIGGYYRPDRPPKPKK